LSFEPLQSRVVLSLTFGAGGVSNVADFVDDDQLQVADAKGGGGKGGSAPGPAIDLPTVVLHELGHSLGLPHSTDPACGTTDQPVMCPYYIGPAFRLMSEDAIKINSLYPSNAEVPNSGDGRWDDPSITFSFMPDGTSIDQGGRKGSELFSVMQKAIGDKWQSVFVQALNLWAGATNNALTFHLVDDDSSPFNTSGAVQGDSRFGDIRFGSHKFDGPGGVLAHAYFPPPNGATAAGDAHFAKEENWQNLSGLDLSPIPAPATGLGNLTSAHGRGDYPDSPTGIRSSELETALSILAASLTDSTGAIAPAESDTTETHAMTTSPTERNADHGDHLGKHDIEQYRRGISTLLASITAAAPAESVAASEDSSHDHDLIAAWDEVLRCL